MGKESEIKVTSNWDKNVVPADERRKRGLLVEIEGIAKQKVDRRAVNLCLVIDRSGSMGGGKIEAAKKAAIGVVEQLGDKDVLSVVDFDNDISVLVSGIQLTERGKENAIRQIQRLSSRGSTDLGGGWLEGATQAAKAMDKFGFKNGHVVLLSDGHANVGVMDPFALRAHADEMASRGVTTSTVGVGNNYSPLQLEALSEGGLGRLHDAATPDEIIETILGELGEVLSVAATDLGLSVRWDSDVNVDMLANFETNKHGNLLEIRLGDLVGGSKRTIPLVFDVPPLPIGQNIGVELVISAKDPETGKRIEETLLSETIRIVSAEESAATDRDLHVADRMSLIWESTIGLTAMRLNEQGDFAGASHHVRELGQSLKSFSIGTDSADSIAHCLEMTESRVGREWTGRSKRAAMIAAKKFSKGERDHRSSSKGNWNDYR